MNFRLVLLIFLVVLFAAGTGYLSYSQSTGLPLKEAYDNGNVVITQNTSAGTVPHQVVVVNNGRDPVKVQVGDVLTANSSQDLVVAENKTVSTNSSETIYAYCLDPSTQAVVGSKLKANGTASNAIKQVIDGSNIHDLNNATNAQLELWILTAGVNFNIYSGEPVALVNTQKITYTTLKQMVTNSKSNLASQFNVKVDNIKNINQNSTQSSDGTLKGVYHWFKSMIGMG
ncbi:hypothetical protein Metbo_1013 [Methanobacterium lacus]|uniref:Uncharacterized protein n=1 Tax=Methanobacterium lacus (strain AL-21) TaxID=877455 RepID=F0TCI3_METLA|nr:hypothetical protein [Methanobacterium lacus]ADZ09260.1 hypothetical protein Metbo_1013 [Methanobacterium lacus]